MEVSWPKWACILIQARSWAFPSRRCLFHESLMIIRPHFISRRPRRTPRMGNQGMEKERHQQQQVKHLGDQPARQSPTRAINELCSSSSSSAGHIINIILWFIDLVSFSVPKCSTSEFMKILVPSTTIFPRNRLAKHSHYCLLLLLPLPRLLLE